MNSKDAATVAVPQDETQRDSSADHASYGAANEDSVQGTVVDLRTGRHLEEVEIDLRQVTSDGANTGEANIQVDTSLEAPRPSSMADLLDYPSVGDIGHGRARSVGPTTVRRSDGLDPGILVDSQVRLYEQESLDEQERLNAVSARLAEIFAEEPTVDADEIFRREAVTAELSGQRTLLRAGATSAAGGLIIALVSMAFGPRFFVADIRLLGICVGMSIVALSAVAQIGTKVRKAALGALIIVGAVLSFPIAAGGYFAGSIIAVVGGAMLVAYEPPVAAVTVVVRRAGRIRRFAALWIDFLAAFVLQRILNALIPDFFLQALNVVISWIFVWFVVAVVPCMWTRRTPGRIVLMERVVDADTGGRALLTPAVIRELIRGVMAIGSLILFGQVVLRSNFNLWGIAAATVVVVLIGFVAEFFDLLDRATGTRSVFDTVVSTSEEDHDHLIATEAAAAEGHLSHDFVSVGDGFGESLTTASR